MWKINTLKKNTSRIPVSITIALVGAAQILRGRATSQYQIFSKDLIYHLLKYSVLYIFCVLILL